MGLLGGEVVAGFGGTFAWALARGGQLTLGVLRKPLETHPGEHLDSVVPIANMLTTRATRAIGIRAPVGRMASPA